jgi:hypothetical protein
MLVYNNVFPPRSRAGREHKFWTAGDCVFSPPTPRAAVLRVKVDQLLRKVKRKYCRPKHTPESDKNLKTYSR